MIGDEDEVERAEAGAEGQGTEGQGDGPGGQAADLPAEQPDTETDDGGEEEVAAGQGGERPSRGQARFQRLANDTREARERAERAEREIAELRRQQWAQQSNVTEQQERERLALMTPDERAEYQITRMRREMEHQRYADRINSAAQMDKIAYEAKAAANPVYSKFAPEVERRFQEQLSKGQPVERELILKLVLGERALAGASAGADTVRRQARGRVASQQVAAGSGKGDTASDRGKAGDTPEKRLRDVFI